MKKKRIAAAGLAVIMALTAAGCHQTSKEDTAQTTVKENKEEKDTSKEQIEKEETEKKVLHPYIHTDSVSGYVNSADGSVPVFRRSTRKFPSFSSCHFFISFPASRFFLYLQQIFNALLGLFLLKKFF